MPRKAVLPTVRLRRLASELRRYRELAELTREDVTARTRVNDVTLYRIEKAQARPQVRTLLALLDAYGVTDEATREALILLTKESGQQQAWLQAYEGELPEELMTYVAFESEARMIKNYETIFIPGLLQTESYARAVIAGAVPVADAEYVEQRVEARMQRREVLTKPDPLRLWAVVDEAAVTRQAGGPDVMIEQLDHLADMAGAPNITLQVVTFEAGAHSGMLGPFSIMEFHDPADPALVYVDNMAGNTFVEREMDLRRFDSIFDHLVASALSPADTVSRIRRVAGTLKA